MMIPFWQILFPPELFKNSITQPFRAIALCSDDRINFVVYG
jgi:hypothetical protein